MVLQMLFTLFCFSVIALILSIHNHLKNKPKLHHPPTPYGLPIIGHLHLLGPLIHRSFAALSAKHGPLISLRLGSVPCIIVSAPQLAEEFLKTNELNFSARKQSIAIKRLTYDASFAFAPCGPYWKFVKKIFTHQLLSNSSLDQFRPVRASELACFIRVLSSKAKCGECVNVTTELLKLTNNIISQTMLSIRCSGTTSEADQARGLVREVTQIFGEFNVSDFIWFLCKFDFQGFRRRFEDTHRRYDALLENIIKRREKMRRAYGKDSPEAKDFLEVLLDVSEDGNSEEKLTRDHIKAIILDFFTAATDTSAIAIEWAIAELINNSKIMKKAQDEVDNIVGKTRLVSENDSPNLPYIQAIIKETLRLHPPIPFITRKAVRDCTVSGYNISANTLLFVNIWSIGRNSKYWESPMDFRPERFLEPGPTGPIDIKGRHFQLLPFGTGRRGCPGMTLAMLELVTVVAAMVQCFDWNVATVDGTVVNGCARVVDMTERPGLTTPRANDLVCALVRRNHELGL